MPLPRPLCSRLFTPWMTSLIVLVSALGCTTDGPMIEATSTPADVEDASFPDEGAPRDQEDTTDMAGDEDIAPSGDQGQSLPAPVSPPRWVLRDRTRSEATDVALAPYQSPLAFDPQSLYAPEFDAPIPRCVAILGTRQTRLKSTLSYDLDTGTMAPCFTELPHAYFGDARCSSPLALYHPTAPVLYRGEVMASWGSGMRVTSYYARNHEDVCTLIESAVPINAWELRPFPEHLQNLLAEGAPYTLSWE